MLDALAVAVSGLLLGGGAIYLVAGALVGLLFGVIPGLGGPTALALLIPLTFGVDTSAVMFFAGGIMGAIPAGGSVTAILLNTPGTAPNAATVYDGYAMTRNGQGGAALGAAATASSIGGVLGIFILFAILPAARSVILQFSPPEYCLLGVLGLCAIAVSSDGKLVRGLLAASLGLMLAFVGYDNVGGGVRFTAGIDYLWDGIPLIPALIGLFAIAQILSLCVSGGSIAEDPTAVNVNRVSDGVFAVFRYFPTVLRGSAIGAVVGSIPAVGGTVAAFLAYSVTAQTSKNPESFGKGNIEGVIAPEAANNAREGGALIPTLAFGIPGSAEMAVFLGLLILHGLQPGPTLLINHLDVIASLLLSIALACVVASLVCVAVARRLALMTLIDVNWLVPAILAVSTVGAFALRGNFIDAVVTIVFGFIGYAMLRLDYPRLPLVIALFLGEVVEVNFRQSLMIAAGDWTIFLSRGLSLTLLILIVLSIAVPLVRFVVRRKRGQRNTLEPIAPGGSLPSVALAAVAVGYVAISYRYDAASQILPWIAGSLAIALAVADVLSQRGRARSAVTESAESAEDATMPSQATGLRDEIVAFIWIGAFLPLVVIFGFYAAVLLYVFSFLRLHAGKGAVGSISVSVMLTVCLYAVFGLLMGYDVYGGLLGGQPL
jgi:putative tricarboxylic transport membrane protein